MTKIKGKVSDIKELLTLIKLEGKDVGGSTTSMIDNCILDCKEGKINVRVLAKTNTVIAYITYKKLDIVTDGELPIGSLDEFISYLKRFEPDDEVTIEDVENKIKIIRETPKKTASIPLTARENIDDSLRAESTKDSLTMTEEGWKFRNTILPAGFQVNTHYIKQVLDDGSVQGLSRKYPILIGDEVICTVGDIKGGMIETIIPVENINGKAESSFAAGIDNVISNLSGVIEIYMAEKGPMLVIQSNETIDAKFIIAPLIDEED